MRHPRRPAARPAPALLLALAACGTADRPTEAAQAPAAAPASATALAVVLASEEAADAPEAPAAPATAAGQGPDLQLLPGGGATFAATAATFERLGPSPLPKLNGQDEAPRVATTRGRVRRAGEQLLLRAANGVALYRVGADSLTLLGQRKMNDYEPVQTRWLNAHAVVLKQAAGSYPDRAPVSYVGLELARPR